MNSWSFACSTPVDDLWSDCAGGMEIAMKSKSISCLLLFGCGMVTPSASTATDKSVQDNVQRFIDRYAAKFVELEYAEAEAQWALNTRIVEGDDTNAKRAREAGEAVAAYTGSIENIETCRDFLRYKDQLEPLQVKQLERILYMAANNPQTVAGLVKERIAADEATRLVKFYGKA